MDNKFSLEKAVLSFAQNSPLSLSRREYITLSFFSQNKNNSVFHFKGTPIRLIAQIIVKH